MYGIFISGVILNMGINNIIIKIILIFLLFPDLVSLLALKNTILKKNHEIQILLKMIPYMLIKHSKPELYDKDSNHSLIPLLTFILKN